jgi:hypothetical protein
VRRNIYLTERDKIVIQIIVGFLRNKIVEYLIEIDKDLNFQISKILFNIWLITEQVASNKSSL